jgi:riboflavin biosynthesis pyrimidine reductase
VWWDGSNPVNGVGYQEHMLYRMRHGADWAESRIARGDLAEDIGRLKREPGGVILAHGGATFVNALIHDGLIDEYRLVIQPVAIGHGTGLFSALREPLRVDLIEARRFASGTAIHVYRPRKENR